MHLLRCLFFIEARYGFEHSASHIAGKDNKAADALSRNQLVSFFSIVPDAPRMPRRVPTQLLELLLDPSLDWTDARWARLYSASLHLLS